MEKDRDDKAPYIQWAVDMRLRNFENAREFVLKLPRGEIDWNIVEKGNNVAHRAYGRLDSGLFKLGLIPEDYKAAGEKIFEELYGIKPTNYGCWYPKAERLMDCRVSIRALKPLNNTSNVTENLRAEHSTLDSEILEHHKEFSQHDFESSSVVEEKLVKLEALTDEIIQLDRSRRPRRRRAVPAVSSVLDF